VEQLRRRNASGFLGDSTWVKQPDDADWVVWEPVLKEPEEGHP
jgi:hypothetical protein